MIVEILHPAPVELVPARSRRARVVHVAALTTASIDEIPLGAVERDTRHAGEFDHLLRVAGRPGHWCWQTGLADRQVSRGAFAAFLSGGDQIPHGMRHTPIHACGSLDARLGYDPHAPGSRGDDKALGDARSILSDGRELAALRARAFVEGSFLIAGDGVLVRAAPIASACDGKGDVEMRRASDLPRLASVNHSVATPATFDALGARMGCHATPRRLSAWRSFEDGGASAGLPARIAANSLPGLLRRILADAARGPCQARAHVLAPHIPVLARMEVEGMTGTCGLDDPEADLARIADAARAAVGALASTGNPWPAVARHLRGCLAAIDTIYRPSLPGHALDPGDAQALSSLSPVP